MKLDLSSNIAHWSLTQRSLLTSHSLTELRVVCWANMGKWLVAACLRGCYRKKKARKKVGQFLQTWQPRRSQRFILAREWKGGGEQRIQYRITLGIDRSLGYNWVCGRLNSFEVVNDRRLGVGNLSRRGDIS